MVFNGERAWRLTFPDGVQLCNPDGVVVRFPYQKVEDLFLALARGSSEGISRDAICDRLWPHSLGSARQLSLRQTLSRLRKIIGQESLITSRTNCRLSSQFPLIIENSSPMKRNETLDLEAQASLMSGFVSMIEWLAQNDPCQMFEMMRASIDFACATDPSVLLGLLDLAAPKLPPNFPLKCWVPFWRGFAIFSSSNVKDARPYFSLAAEASELQRDSLLLAETYFWWGASEILMGRSLRALRISERARATLSSWGKSDRDYKINNLKGTALLHLNRNEEALKIFESVTGYGNLTTLDFANHEVLRALYLATLGQFTRAREVLEFPMRRADETGLVPLNCLCRLAVGVIESREEPLRAIKTLGALVESTKVRRYSHLAMYSQETLAVAHFRIKNFGESKALLAGASEMRKRLSMAYTGWDLKRLEPLTGVTPS